MVRKRSFILASVGVLVLAVHPALAQGVPDLLLTSDRLLYRPGQKIHLRALVLDLTTRRAMPRQRVSFSVRSPAGLLLSERTLTNRFGVAATSLPLVKEAPVGAYRVTASSGSCVVRKDLRVKEYDLPRHQIQVKPSGKYLARAGASVFRSGSATSTARRWLAGPYRSRPPPWWGPRVGTSPASGWGSTAAVRGRSASPRRTT